MEYKLKCDLPLAKAGTPINFFGNGSSDKINIEVTKDGTLKIWITDITRINEWVEEVKPREWYEIIYGVELLVDRRFQSVREAEIYLEGIAKPSNAEIIKVREVIE